MDKFLIKYYGNNAKILPEEYKRMYISPLVGESQADECMTLIRYQLFCVWLFPHEGISYRDPSSQRTFVKVEAFNLNVFFRLVGNVCNVYEAVA